ncbi:hypothetical protein FACS189435_0990 [Bacteroidia bacterium]|nr:hypothetical protein FACS189435_0990 [Bacteroidia bacterium]
MKRCFFLLLMGLMACNATYHSSIPSLPVYLELDLGFQDKDLVPLQAFKIYTKKNVTLAVERTGYGGVLVYHALDNNYYAFDAACPHEANASITVQIDESRLHAICPKCQSNYDLSYGNANPVEGPSREALKRYPLTLSGNKIYVRN